MLKTVVSWLQTTQIILDVCFRTDHVAYASSNKTKKSMERELFSFFFIFLPGVDASHVYVRAWALGCFYNHISTHNPSIAFRHLPPRKDVVDQCLD